MTYLPYCAVRDQCDSNTRTVFQVLPSYLPDEKMKGVQEIDSQRNVYRWSQLDFWS
jgi:hypothetical protein